MRYRNTAKYEGSWQLKGFQAEQRPKERSWLCMLIFNLIYIRSIIFLSRVSCYVLGYFVHNCRWQFLQLLLNFVLIICLLCCLKLEHQLLVLNMSFFQVLFNFFLLVLKTNFHLITLYFLHVFMKKTIMSDVNLFSFWLLMRMQIESIFCRRY